MTVGRYRVRVTGHRSQVQVIILLISNWNKLSSISDFDSSWREFIMLWTFVLVMKLMFMDCITRQKYESALEGTDVVAVMSLIKLIVMSSCIKVSKRHNFHWAQWKADKFTSSVKKCLNCLQLVNRDQFSSCICMELQLYKANNKRLYGILRDTYRLSAIIYSSNEKKWVN